MKLTKATCPQCGAPLRSEVCDYCQSLILPSGDAVQQFDVETVVKPANLARVLDGSLSTVASWTFAESDVQFSPPRRGWMDSGVEMLRRWLAS